MHTTNLRPKLPRSLRFVLVVSTIFACIATPLHAGPIGGIINAATTLARGVIGLPFRVLSSAKNKTKSGVTANTAKTTTKD